jgi:malate dehydrogenase (oxaloacetate-decarboxylating)
VMRDAGLSEQEAYRRFYAVDRYGLLFEGGQGLRSEQAPFARPKSDLVDWKLSNPREIGLLDVVQNAKPTVLIGVSGQAGAFTEDIIRATAKSTERPVIFPLSNPTSRSEATPQQVLDWTNGRALIGTGSPFGPCKFNGKEIHIDQTNNSYIFPGLALGIISSKARQVSDAMIKAAAIALAELAPTRQNKRANLLPPLASIRSVSLAIAKAVGNQAIKEGSATVDEDQFEQELAANIWEPVYEPYERV